MSKTLSDTAAIAGRAVMPTADPGYSCFHPRSHKAMCDPPRATGAGSESLRHAVQVLKAERPPSGKGK